MGEHITKIDLQAFRAVPGTFAMELPDGRSCVVLEMRTKTPVVKSNYAGEVRVVRV